MTKKYYKLEVIPEGTFNATITNYDLSTTSDDKTTFLCLTLSVRHNQESFEVQKYFIVNKCRNQKLYQFVQDMGILQKKGNRVSYDELINASCSVDLYYNSDGKLVVGDIEPAEDDPDDVDFTDEDEE